MTYYLIKVIISAMLIVLISEAAKRNSFAGAIIASLPITSVLAFIWIYVDTGNLQKISDLSRQIVWLVIPSLVLFIALPVLLKHQTNFYLSLLLAMVLTAAAYFILIFLLRKF